MKRITILVPDKMTRTITTARNTYAEDIDVDQGTIVRALVNNEYDVSYHFSEGSVQVESVETIHNA